MIAAGFLAAADPRTGDRDQQKNDAQDLEQQAPRLLDPASMLQLGPDVRCRPEPQRRDHLLALGAIQKIQRDYAGGNRSRQRDQFAETEI